MLKEGYTQHFNEAWSMAANGRNGRIPILATEGPGGPGFGMRYEDFLSWTYATQCGVTIFEGMVHYGPPAAYPYQVKSGFLYKDGWARDLGTINMLRYLAGQQNGYAGTNQINEKLQTTYPGYPANGWVPFYPLGEGVWSGVGGAEIVTLLRNWSGASPPNYGNPYPKLTPTSNIPTADAYAAIFSGVFGDCVWLNRVSQAESLQFNGYLSAYDTAAKNGNWQAAEDQLQINMLPKLLQWMNVNPPITYASQL